MCINLSFAPSGVIKSFCAPLNLACTGDGPSADASADGSADGSFNSFLSFLHPPKWLLESHDAPRPSPQWGSIGALVLELYESCASRDGQPNYSAGMSGQSLGAEKFKCVDGTDSTKHPQSALENPFALGVEIYNHAAPALALRPGADRQRIKSAANPRSRSTRTMIVATSDHSIAKRVGGFKFRSQKKLNYFSGSALVHGHANGKDPIIASSRSRDSALLSGQNAASCSCELGKSSRGRIPDRWSSRLLHISNGAPPKPSPYGQCGTNAQHQNLSFAAIASFYNSLDGYDATVYCSKHDDDSVQKHHTDPGKTKACLNETSNWGLLDAPPALGIYTAIGNCAESQQAAQKLWWENIFYGNFSFPRTPLMNSVVSEMNKRNEVTIDAADDIAVQASTATLHNWAIEPSLASELPRLEDTPKRTVQASNPSGSERLQRSLPTGTQHYPALQSAAARGSADEGTIVVSQQLDYIVVASRAIGDGPVFDPAKAVYRPLEVRASLWSLYQPSPPYQCPSLEACSNPLFPNHKCPNHDQPSPHNFAMHSSHSSGARVC